MKNYLILINLFVLTISSCQNRKDSIEDKFSKEKNTHCSILLKKFQQKMIIEENDSALYYIDKAIHCDKNNKNFIYQKVNFLKNIRRFSDAIKEIELLNIDNNVLLNIEIAVLKLKIKDPNSNILLKKYYSKLYNKSSLTSTEEIYLISLENYFISSSRSLERIKVFKIKNKENLNNINIAKEIEQSIINNKKEEVLYNLFNIDLE